ncbi:hypothetical protein EG329_012673 [Mollisiaceae sp. DMI_Dod_QoI]|nr:hypothetical protein EG329_012673 [Helotiales sp. DMI_Dod_QoI]
MSLWMRHHAEDHSSSSGPVCVRALGTLFFGRAHCQQDITTMGYDLYGQALISLNTDIQDAETAWSLSVVKSAMVLELYEMIAFNPASGWLKHAGGVGRLIELRGPWRHQPPEARRLFEATRQLIALESLAKRKRCFLESSEWKTIPWALEPDSKLNIYYLHDILCDIPGLMEDANMLQSSELSPEDFTTHHTVLSENIFSCLKTLYEWRVSWQRQNPDSCWEVLSTELSRSAGTQALFPIVFQFTSLPAATDIALYNAVLLLLLRLGFQVIGPQFDFSLAISSPQDINYGPLIPPGLAPDARSVAIEICKSVDYHLVDDRRGAGAFFLLFPLRVAWQALHPASPEAVWLKSIMSIIADSTGFEISRGLTRNDVIQATD